MRISDWSSDVCSSDLLGGCGISVGLAGVGRRAYIFFSGGAGERLGRSSGGLPLGSSITRPGPLLVERLQRDLPGRPDLRSEEHTSELQSLMRLSYAVFSLKKKNTTTSKIVRH